ncbi:MAG: hypothetical protein BWY38_03274 [Ignavibacteria bacterium ADurb.Bin266]|nr:MAG: hypothetical protein BWY38_03274 [Ignavibacteria bacterium ADurb.Bin266]
MSIADDFIAFRCSQVYAWGSIETIKSGSILFSAKTERAESTAIIKTFFSISFIFSTNISIDGPEDTIIASLSVNLFLKHLTEGDETKEFIFFKTFLKYNNPNFFIVRLSEAFFAI